ncbi:MAG: hypothetical protein ABI866_04055, partial [Dokdonella sp.]
AIHGTHLKVLLQFRHTCHPWHSPESAPAIQAYMPSMALKTKKRRSAFMFNAVASRRMNQWAKVRVMVIVFV